MIIKLIVFAVFIILCLFYCLFWAAKLEHTFEEIMARSGKKMGKETIYSKSIYATEVLRLMDEDYSYQESLNIVLSKYPLAKKAEIENELNLYI